MLFAHKVFLPVMRAKGRPIASKKRRPGRSWSRLDPETGTNGHFFTPERHLLHFLSQLALTGLRMPERWRFTTPARRRPVFQLERSNSAQHCPLRGD